MVKHIYPLLIFFSFTLNLISQEAKISTKFSQDGNLYQTSTKASQTIAEFKENEKKRLELEVRLQQAHKMESIGRLAGGVAHEFNNLLTVIMGTGELALYEIPVNAELYKELTTILTTAQRAEVLVRQLLAFSRKQIIEP